MALDRVKQTSRTLLIEEFDENKVNLASLLRTEDVHRKSEFLNKLKENLEVSTFQEFVERFAPKVYEYTVQSDDPEMPMSFRYTFEKDEGVNEVEISKHAFYRMVMDIYEDRAESGESNTKTETFKRMAELLSPVEALRQAKRTRVDLAYVTNQIKKLEQKGETDGAEWKRYKSKQRKIRKNIIKTYNKSAIGLIPLALADTQNKLEKLASDSASERDNEEKPKALPCAYYFNNAGDLQVERLEQQSDTDTIERSNGMAVEVINATRETDNKDVICSPYSGEENNEMQSRLKKDFLQHSNQQANGDFFANLVVETYTGYSLAETEQGKTDIVQLEKKKNVYTKIYQNAQEQFINTISDIVEKMLGIKVFFDHASRNGKPLAAPLIVANCKASALLENEVKNNFVYYIEEMRREPAENAIWFAIIPGVGDSDFVDLEYDMDDDCEDDISSEEVNATNDDDVKSGDGKVLISMDSCKALVEILKKGKITTFFNYKANEKTGFENFTGEIIEKYKSETESLIGNKYAVFAYPNFTVIPKKETQISIGSITNDNGRQQEVVLDLPGIYVEASYVAAGLIVGSQDPYILKDKGFQVELNSACVRFDFEEKDNNKIMVSRMAREGDAVWDSQAEEIIVEDMFGFCFCGNNMYYDNKPIKNTYVFSARTMQKDENSGKFKSVYKTLVEKYIILYLSLTNGGSSAKKSDVEKFVKNTVHKWKRDTDAIESKDYVNNILRDGEDIFFSDDNKIHVKFKDDDELIDLEVVEE